MTTRLSAHGTSSIALFLLIVLSEALPCAAVMEWTWVGGSDAANQLGVYGTKGLAAPGNMPGARWNSGNSWTDSSGNLWLFGGYGYAASGDASYLNDLWKFDGTSWTWVGGSNTTSHFGIYGTPRVAAPANIPGSRWASASRTDSSGNLWLFGGLGFAASGAGYLNDLWKFDGTNWTWFSGSNGASHVGVYGTKGVAASANVPGGRYGCSSWKDSSGNFWLFGGYGYAASGMGYLNDLWKFDGTNWTWVAGSNAPSQVSTYGVKGVPAAGNVPGARYDCASWTDSGGNLWLFAGDGHTADNSGYLNDLWKFDGTNWTWVGGSNAIDQYGVYGTQGSPAPGNAPGSRSDAVARADAGGNIWLFGGYGFAESGSEGVLNDLWKFDGTSWTWVGGSKSPNQSGVYGTMGQAAPGNVPGGRYGMAGWLGSGGSFWLMGGYSDGTNTAGYLNDLWKFSTAVVPADLNGDGVVNSLDLLILASQWETAPTGAPSADIAPQQSGDGIVNFRDFAILAAAWMQGT